MWREGKSERKQENHIGNNNISIGTAQLSWYSKSVLYQTQRDTLSGYPSYATVNEKCQGTERKPESDVNRGTLLCRYRKRTDIYYSTWSLENVSKSCQFQFFRPPQNRH